MIILTLLKSNGSYLLLIPEDSVVGNEVTLELESPNPAYDPARFNFALDDAKVFSPQASENCEKIAEKRLRDCSISLEKVGTEKSHFQVSVLVHKKIKLNFTLFFLHQQKFFTPIFV